MPARQRSGRPEISHQHEVHNDQEHEGPVPVEQWQTGVRPTDKERIDSKEEEEVKRIARQRTSTGSPDHTLRGEDDARGRRLRGDTGQEGITTFGHTLMNSKRRAQVSK
jgi:hypothetical protein